ncbi:MAG: aminopeptidase [Luteitalea sp.]|nr:aminopeptidase [Luteitalea sp.]
MRAFAILTMALLVTPTNRGGAQPPPAAGISTALAEERAARLSDLRYDLSFRLPGDRRERVTGRVTITFRLQNPSMPLALDFAPGRPDAIRSVTAGDVPIEARVADGHVVLPSSALRAGLNTIAIDFDAGDPPLNRSEDFLYTIFVPARAHEAFPCFDQPDLKARWTLALDAPGDWVTVANGAEVTRETRREAEGERVKVGFAPTEPIPTYLFAFAAGRFSVEEAERNGRRFRMLHRETDVAKVRRNRDAIFDLHATALEWLERYTGIPYPFGKFDFVLVPAFQFGGMEHPGAVFYNASGLMLEESATQNQELERASTISHETAHMWFGDLVTMRWFTDVWMKEVFANFMAARIVNPSFPGINHDLRFLHAYYPAAYDVDRTAGTNAIRQPLDNLNQAGTLYGAIIYQKAPIVMRQLEMLTGADRFRSGVRDYLRRYRFGNASWPDLIALLDAHTPEDLAAWSRAWVEEAGRPIVTTELEVQDGRIVSLGFGVSDPDRRRGLTWTEELHVALGYADRVQTLPVRLAGTRVEVIAARGLSAPLFVLPNGAGLGYGEFHLDPASLAWLGDRLPDVDGRDGALTRGSAWVTLWDAMLNGQLAPERVVDLALRALPREGDELNVQRILSYLEQAYWRFTPEAERSAKVAEIERVLRQGLADASSRSLKGAYFASLRNVAQTASTLEWLARVWRRDETVPGLTLAETDDIALAQALAVREVEGWEAMLRQQVERTLNPDRKARLQFVLPALSADPTERDRFFASLANGANRRREAWVLDGLRSLHHPLRAAESARFVTPSLALLEEIQRTGDIFFPKRWIDSTLSGHRSESAAGMVRSFLADVPATYPDRLRRIILSSADDLFRASRVR